MLNLRIPKLKILIFFFLLFCTFIAVSIQPSKFVATLPVDGGVILKFIVNLNSQLANVQLVHVLALSLITMMLYKEIFAGETEICKMSVVMAGIFALFMLVGMSFAHFYNFDFIFGNKKQFPVSMIVLCGLFSIFYCIFHRLYFFIDNFNINEDNILTHKIFVKIDNDFFRICFELMFVFWTAQNLFFYPGNLPHDPRYQLLQFDGVYVFNSQHPVFGTLVMGSLFKVGNILLGKFGGIRFCTFLLGLSGSFVFSQICDFVKKQTKSLACGIFSFLYFALVPPIWANVLCFQKDAFFLIVFSLYVLQFFKIFFHRETKYSTFILITAGVVSCLFRKDCVYVIAPALLFFSLAHSHKAKIIASLLLIIFFSLFINHSLEKKLCSNKFTAPDYLVSKSLYLQIIGRVVKYHGHELDGNQKQIIDDVIIFDTLPDRYNPEVADYIFFRHRNLEALTDMQWKQFYGLWKQFLLKYPLTCIEAVVNEMFGYFYPFYFAKYNGQYNFYIKEPLGEADQNIAYSEYKFPYPVRAIMIESTKLWNNLPFLSFFVNPAFYTWVGIFLISCIIRRKEFKYLVLFIAPFMCVLICFASPVNGYLRYVLPVMCAMPLYVFSGLHSCANYTNEDGHLHE